MIKQTVLALAVGSVMVSGAWAAKFSPSQERGMDNCQSAVRAETGIDRLVHKRKYYVAEGASERTYFINSNGYQDGAWVALGSECVTSKNGMYVTSLAVQEGHFSTHDGRVRVEVAGR